MLNPADLIEYAQNREQNLQTLYRRCRTFMAAYEEHEAVKKSESGLLTKTQQALESARQDLASSARLEENNARHIIERTSPPPRKRR